MVLILIALCVGWCGWMLWMALKGWSVPQSASSSAIPCSSDLAGRARQSEARWR